MRSCGQPSVNRSAGTMRRLAASAPGSAAAAKTWTLRAAAACGPQGLLRSGARDLSLHPPHRLTKRYHREWCLRRSIAQAELDGLRRQPVAYLFGVPRYMIGTAVRSLAALAVAVVRGDWNSRRTFSRELTLWELMGFVAGTIRRRLRRRASGTSLAPSLNRG